MRIVQLSDLHLDLREREPYGIDTWSRFSWACEVIAREHPDLVVVTGDICLTSGDEATLREVHAALSRFSCDVLLLPGNHDDRSLFSTAFGRRYVLQATHPYLDRRLLVGGHTMIMLDTADGVVAPQQLAWLESVLASEGAAAARGERPSTVVIWSHHPLICGAHRYMDAHYPLRNAAAVEAVLEAAAPQLTPVVLSGHYHSAATIERGHVTQHIAPATYMQIDPNTNDFQPDATTFGIRFVSIDGRGTVSTSVHMQSLSPGS